MPDESKAAEEHALLAQITEPLAALPSAQAPVGADAEFPVVLRGYDRVAVDAYVSTVSEELTQLRAAHSPDLAVRRALERVGEQISGILQRAHETAAQITTQSRQEAEHRLERARQEAEQIVSGAREKARELDADVDRIWSERARIVEDARKLGDELTVLATAAADRFPAAGEETGDAAAAGAFTDEVEERDALAAQDAAAEGSVEAVAGEEPMFNDDALFEEESVFADEADEADVPEGPDEPRDGGHDEPPTQVFDREDAAATTPLHRPGEEETLRSEHPAPHRAE